MADNQESASGGVADCNEPALVVGMIGILKGRCQGIIEHSDGFVERHAMPLGVRCGFASIPLEARIAPFSRM